MILAWKRETTMIHRRRLRRTALGLLALLAATAAPGCSYLKSSMARPDPSVGAPAAGDPYLMTHAPVAPRTDAALAARDRSPQLSVESMAESTPTIVRSTAHPVSAEPAVDLDPPVTLPTAPAADVQAAAPTRPRLEEETPAKVVARAKARLATMATYQVQLTRQERVGEALLPAEEVLLSIRRSPKGVRLEWQVGSHRGREVLFSATDPSGNLHVNMADSLVPVPKLNLPPTSPMVMSNSRHPITEAGFDTIVDNLESNIAHSSDGGAVRYVGLVTPPELGRPCRRIVRTTPTRETWEIDFDAATDLPARVHGTAANGVLLEDYRFNNVVANPPNLAAADAFDADKRWGSTAGAILGKIARPLSGSSSSTQR